MTCRGCLAWPSSSSQYASMLLNMAQAEQLLGNEACAQELFSSALKRAKKVAGA